MVLAAARFACVNMAVSHIRGNQHADIRALILGTDAKRGIPNPIMGAQLLHICWDKGVVWVWHVTCTY